MSIFRSRRRRLVALLPAAALLLTALSRESARAEMPTLRSEQAPDFSTDLAVIRDGEGRPSLVATTSIPYTELQWVRGARGYSASVEITVAADSRGSRRGYGGTRQRDLLVPGYAATRSPNSSLVERDTLGLPPGRYDLRVGVHDLQGDQLSNVRDDITIEDWSRVPVGFSDLELGSADSSGAFLPNAGHRYGREVADLVARVMVFDRRPGGWPRRYPIVIRIRDESGSVLLTDERTVSVATSGAPVEIKPSRTDLFVGRYRIETELVEGKNHWKVEQSFEVEESGPPQGADFDRMLEPLAYIADESEVEALRKLKPEERSAGWEAFWLKRDPTPDTPRNEALLDFVSRVRYADEHFQGYGAGWRSDMGRIYIRYGAPDQIESRPATGQTPHIEIWYYNQPYRRLVFVDREGFGRFVLAPAGFE